MYHRPEILIHKISALAHPPSHYQKLHRDRQAGILSELPLCPNCQKRRIIPREGKEPKKLLLGDNEVPVCYTCWRSSPQGAEYLTKKKQESRDRRKKAMAKSGEAETDENSASSAATAQRSPLVVLSSPPRTVSELPMLAKYLALPCLTALKNLKNLLSELKNKSISPTEEGTAWKQARLDRLHRLQGQLDITLPLLRCPVSFSDICKLLESPASGEPRSMKLKRLQFQEFTKNLKRI